jgi:hypothetical protein
VPNYYPLSRAFVYVLMNDGHIKSKMLRRHGNVRGARLVSTESIEAYIESCPSE